jgi:hypothetical protein
MENWNRDFDPHGVAYGANPNGVWIADNLKRCPLCGAVNSAANAECFVCRWHGAFDHEPTSIEQGLNDLVAQSPELEEAIQQSEWIPLSQSERLRAFLRKIFWPMD